jgi:glycosyltransferase 2 family protein
MKIVASIAALLGASAAALLVSHYGLGAVGAALASVGWAGFLGIVSIQFATAATCGIAWFVLLPPHDRPPLWIFVWLRLLRNAGSDVLPLSQLAGIVLGVRSATLAGLSSNMSAASTVVDVTMELLSQLAYTGIAATLLVSLSAQSRLITPVAVGLGFAAIVAVLCILAQRRAFPLLKRLAHVLAKKWASVAINGVTVVQAGIDAIYCQRPRLFTAFSLHLLAWIAEAGGIWLALRIMGRPLAPGPVFAIEGLLQAARCAAFIVPNAFGVQEATYVVLGGVFGLGPETSLSLSLLKRARDLSLGIPLLVTWQIVEGRLLWKNRLKWALGFASKERATAPASVPVDGNEASGSITEVPNLRA